MKTKIEMSTSGIRIYGIFIIAFLEMHGLGLLFFNWPYLLNACLTSGAVLLTLLWLYNRCFGVTFYRAIREIGLRKPGVIYLVPGIAISILLLLCYPVLAWLLQTPIQLTDNGLLNLAGLFLTGGLMEEAVFRGFLFGSLRRNKSFSGAVLESLLCFSLAHLLLFTYLDWPIALMSTILAIGLSIPFAYIYEKAGASIWGAAMVHTSIRTIGLVFTTTDEHYSKLAMAWIAVCLLVPYLALLFDTGFRQIWRVKTGKQPGVV